MKVLILAAALCGQAPVQSPVVYRLADLDNRVWVGASFTALWHRVCAENVKIVQRNAAPAWPPVPPVQYIPPVNYCQMLWGSTCPGGNCPR